jgi:hypothetical protein
MTAAAGVATSMVKTTAAKLGNLGIIAKLGNLGIIAKLGNLGITAGVESLTAELAAAW